MYTCNNKPDWRKTQWKVFPFRLRKCSIVVHTSPPILVLLIYQGVVPLISYHAIINKNTMILLFFIEPEVMANVQFYRLHRTCLQKPGAKLCINDLNKFLKKSYWKFIQGIMEYNSFQQIYVIVIEGLCKL